jgi:phosphate transport system protein
MDRTNRLLEKEEYRIHDHLGQMGEMARVELEGALTALESQGSEQAQKVVRSDVDMNHLYRIVEQGCLEALALQQPVARDLRDIVASLQVAGELERIGDHAKDIAKIVLEMDPSDFSGPMEQISRMGDLVTTMLSQAMEAVLNKDEALARLAAEEDSQVDELDEEAVSSLLMQLMTAPDVSMHSTHLLWIAYHLERVGDRVKNIAERVVFMVSSDNVDL